MNHDNITVTDLKSPLAHDEYFSICITLILKTESPGIRVNEKQEI